MAISTILITVQRPLATLLVTATRSGTPATVVVNRGPAGAAGADGSDATVTEAAVLGALGYTPATAAQGALAASALQQTAGFQAAAVLTESAYAALTPDGSTLYLILPDA